MAVGMDPTRLRSHLLRLGGATAWYHVKPDMENLMLLVDGVPTRFRLMVGIQLADRRSDKAYD